MPELNNPRSRMLQLLSNNAERYPHFLENQFPHIFARMIDLWGKPQMKDYLDGLLAPVRKGAVGFPELAINEIQWIMSICYPQPIVEAAKPRVYLPVRETLSRYFLLNFETYPQELESRFPEVLQGILVLLGSPDLDAYIENLLKSETLIAHQFSDQALFEMMTIKSLNQSLTKSKVSEREGVVSDEDEQHIASIVFDRVQRW